MDLLSCHMLSLPLLLFLLLHCVLLDHPLQVVIIMVRTRLRPLDRTLKRVTIKHHVEGWYLTDGLIIKTVDSMVVVTCLCLIERSPVVMHLHRWAILGHWELARLVVLLHVLGQVALLVSLLPFVWLRWSWNLQRRLGLLVWVILSLNLRGAVHLSWWNLALRLGVHLLPPIELGVAKLP